MKIDVVAFEGSPLGVTEQSIYGIDGRRGVGGAELGILTLCRLWHLAGHDVTFYNNPNVDSGSIFKQGHINNFRPDDDRDILIHFRSPDDRTCNAKGKKIWFSCDQYTSGNYTQFSKTVDKIVCISPTHAEYFKTHYGITNTTVIDIPVRMWEFPKNIQKKENSCIYNSVPDRGLIHLAPIWKQIVAEVPDATLTITGDWSLWSNGNFSHHIDQYRRAFAGLRGVNYLSAISREEYLEVLAQKEFHLYPHIAPNVELFCISLAESQVAGAVPITSRYGAVDTTNRSGYKIEGNPETAEFRNSFAKQVIELMHSDVRQDIRWSASQHFDTLRILEGWEKVFRE